MTRCPDDAAARRAVAPVICYPNDTLPVPDLALYAAAREGAEKLADVVVPPREAACFRVAAGEFFRISSIEGPQVGDLNLWNAHDLSERFYSGKTRALHGTHVTRGERLWSSFPHLRPIATIVADSALLGGIMLFSAGEIFYLLCEVLAPQVPSQKGLGPTFRCHRGVRAGLTGHLATGTHRTDSPGSIKNLSSGLHNWYAHSGRAGEIQSQVVFCKLAADFSTLGIIQFKK